MPIGPGQSVAFCDTRGVIWLGFAVSSVISRAGRRGPVVKVRVGSKTVEIADSKVIPWPDHCGTDDVTALLPERIAAPGLGDVVSILEPLGTGPTPIRAADLAVIIGCVSAIEFVIRVDTGLTTRAFADQVAAYQPLIPDFILDTRQVEHRPHEQARDATTDPDP